MSTSWTSPDPRGTALSSGAASVVPAVASPSLQRDAFAGVLAAVVPVLVGAPVGLLWAALAPRVEVVVAGQDVQLAEPGTSAFIAGDGFFLLAGLLAGALGGLLAWRLGRDHGPAVVVGLTLGGLIAAYVAMRVGTTVGAAEVQAAVRAGQQGALELNLRLRAQEALVGWPVGSLLGYVGASFVRGR